MARLDPHSYNDTAHPTTEHLHWKAHVDFDARVLHCEATLHFRSAAEGAVDLDTRDLTIEAVQSDRGEAVPWTLHPADPVLGSKLSLALPPGTQAVTLRYRTSPNASALQWLAPEQTAGKRHPFLFSQCQAIHARSVVPLQDTPRIRITWSAELTFPGALRAVMAAREVQHDAGGGETCSARFEMPQPIPPYLFAFAVGDLTSRELGPRSRVWAEPSVVDAAAHEFAQTDAMIAAAERLFGPYEWERFDLLTMPPSFPYGGMENPRLTFLTPTLLAGDRSLANVVAHELAHSWTGNLVTNASAEHFWLNEGFTVYAERRILEVLEGRDLAELHAALGVRSLRQAIDSFRDRPELTRLRTQLDGVDPDDAYSQVPYEKGYLFLRALEEAVGREAFDRFIHRYVERFRFQSLTTEQFVDFVRRELPGALEQVDADAWLHGEGIPANAPRPKSARLEKVEAMGSKAPDEATAKAWTPTEWQLYLELLSRPIPVSLGTELSRSFQLTRSTNMEILVSWLELALDSGMDVVARTEEVLRSVGRMKYLKPLYGALAKRADLRGRSRAIFEAASPGYHPIARQVVDAMLKKAGA
ncbi:MAG: M1 family metallopeptidase [Myxococcaceae bacterium]|nr:M1 family metallopeptidase [Myxococcaceae bacterium]